MSRFFQTSIEFIKGVGPQKAAMLGKELGIFTYADLIQYYPFRYEDRSVFHTVSDCRYKEGENVQLRGSVRFFDTIGEGRKKRLSGEFSDHTGTIELTWFQGINWVLKAFKPGVNYIVYGKVARYGSKFSIAHPEFEPETTASTKLGLQPVYSSTELLRRKYLDSKGISKIVRSLLQKALTEIPETLPESIRKKYNLPGKAESIRHIHFPADQKKLQLARYRLKFEELFYIQLRLMKLKLHRQEAFKGLVLDKTKLLSEFYEKHLPFDLTGAQKRVLKEIYKDLKSGKQMNRLLQGDVGSGKTIVAFISSLLAINNDAQCALMAPTEILADQHYRGLKPFADELGISIEKLTGSTKKSDRKKIHEGLVSGQVNILVGTHALIEDTVQFQNLGLVIIDEQHRFGVAQRAKLWQKNIKAVPHILVMTATPIPRTLAMTLYGDLEVSVIDELPAGRKPIQTIHQYDAQRLKVNAFLKKELEAGRQVYIVYPLIEESEKLDYKDLMDGFESISRAFPDYQISIVHGKQKPKDKDFEMQRFVKGETRIMVATTVIEVGVNVPNATVMVIENAEKFGLAQLHQLRGRVGRGGDQSYCILMSSYKLSKEARKRLDTMVRTTDGFEIADVDLQLRGPGDLMGTQQSGVLDLLISDLAKDGQIVQLAKEAASDLMKSDPELVSTDNRLIRIQVDSQQKNIFNWSRIS
ncbi:ATP-dependent DNA helicase RecG [Marinigracilibium pacificum]|uniref:ATP-dependent DNA helicase RecG n=1 Tax=Marinigracilibium pacificum TaxID=2729599 RepID=A0A848IXT1_9BACT|nr:ATP-dependent DNA helicase RecG [Marinigracilibium pacificum]NMM47054.1 ATP-dependent DNA helicase RecG [Marinigracilibium pacificum]